MHLIDLAGLAPQKFERSYGNFGYCLCLTKPQKIRTTQIFRKFEAIRPVIDLGLQHIDIFPDDLSIWNQSIDIDPDDIDEPVSSRTRSPHKPGPSRSGVGQGKRPDPGGQFKVPGDAISGII